MLSRDGASKPKMQQSVNGTVWPSLRRSLLHYDKVKEPLPIGVCISTVIAAPHLLVGDETTHSNMEGRK